MGSVGNKITGEVHSYDGEMGTGYIIGDEGGVYFFDESVILFDEDQQWTVEPGDKVTFLLELDGIEETAINVRKK